jgi:hypothetical protein
VSAGRERPGRFLTEEAQRFGLASANRVVDRYLRLVQREIDGDPVVARPAERFYGDAEQRDGPDIDGLTERITEMATAWLHMLEATASLTDGAAAGAAPMATLELPPTGPGLAAQEAIWVHNTTASPVPVALAVTSLAGPAGLVIPADAVSFAPVPMDAVPAGASAEVGVRVRVPDGQGPGRYRGLIVASAADQPMLVRLDVRAAGGAGP